MKGNVNFRQVESRSVAGAFAVSDKMIVFDVRSVIVTPIETGLLFCAVIPDPETDLLVDEEQIATRRLKRGVMLGGRRSPLCRRSVTAIADS
jgi:hypothetical protein